MVDQTHVEKLKKATSTSKLLKYLKKELDWPIVTEELEDNFFEYSPEELQFKPDLAAKIKSISRLRPPSSNIEMPWGIFFIEFSTKNLPLLALRRILNQFVEKKRQSRDLKSWEMGDLLFVSNYGEDEQRKISLCLFNEDKEKSSLPRLKVIEWSDQDTHNALEGVANTLKENLGWPDDDLSTEDWQVQWQSAFISDYRAEIKTSKILAQKLAELAKDVRNRLKEALAIEHENGYLHGQLAEFRKILIHDLDEKEFADMYAQTIAYGLLTAEITNPKTNEGDRIGQIAITNPFLKELLKSFLEPNEQQGASNSFNFDELGISEIRELLDNSDMPSVIRDFGAINPQEDPVIHFYELFLKEYDAKEKVKRGVFYTPRPVVSFIVRSVDELLRKEFNLNYGLADTTTWGEMIKRFDDLEIPEGATHDQAFVQILDPATGTGTFLVETIDLIYKTMTEKWQSEGNNKSKIDELWNEYVPINLLPRLHGYELMMAPYAIAHMKIGLKLYETGYRFENNEPTCIFLTNSLEPPRDVSGKFDFVLPVLANEAEVVNTLKRERRFTVVIGNPPYQLVSANMQETHRELVKHFKFIDGSPIKERGALQLEKILNDDYVKFFAKMEAIICQSGAGVASLITNHAYLDNLTMRGFRYSFLSNFESIYVCDLHGSVKKKQDLKDECVFDIQLGVAISLLSKMPNKNSKNTWHSELVGPRVSKYKALSSSTICTMNNTLLQPSEPNYLMVPMNERLWTEYKKFTPIPEIFPMKSIGLFTSKDSLVINPEKNQVVDKVEQFRQSELSNEDLCDQVGIKAKKAWDVTKSRDQLHSLENISDHIVEFKNRPFDKKYLFYHKSLVWSMAYPVNQNLIDVKNIALTVSRQLATPPWSHVFCSNTIVELCYISNKTKEGNHVFPLYIKPPQGNDLFAETNAHLVPNISQSFLKLFWSQSALDDSSVRELKENNGPESVFFFCYALLHSPQYRIRYEDFLKTDFPRLPIPRDSSLLVDLIEIGSRLKALHLEENVDASSFLGKQVGEGNFRIEKVSYSDNTVWIDKEKTCGFKGVPEEVWNFHIGSYQVCEKWLKDRQAKGGKNPSPGRVLTDEDINHYQKMIVAISETIRIMGEIDEVIEEHGGWPDAFKANDLIA